jgi:hypothetical protein
MVCACNAPKSERGKTGEGPAHRSPGEPTKFQGSLSQPAEAQLDLHDKTFAEIEGPQSETLFRYLAGNPRWEIREEGGPRFAIRKEKQGGAYATSLNGFYSVLDGEVMHQTRVLISFQKEHGFGDEHGNVTRTKAGSKNTALTVEGEHAGSPGNSSYLIVDGGPVFLEIFEQAPQLERRFSQAVFDEVSAELRDVMANAVTIEKTGILPIPGRYPVALPTAEKFEVRDGMQPGIYMVDAAVASRAAGTAYIKAFRVDTGEQLSEERVQAKTTRHLGWSNDGGTFFPYTSEVTIYEGDWSTSYEARFELWQKSVSGSLVKLAESTRSIHGWQH